MSVEGRFRRRPQQSRGSMATQQIGRRSSRAGVIAAAKSGRSMVCKACGLYAVIFGGQLCASVWSDWHHA